MNKKAFILLFIGIFCISSFAISSDKCFKASKIHHIRIPLPEDRTQNIVNILYCKWSKKYIFLNVIETSEAFRNKGFGTALLKYFCNEKFPAVKDYTIELDALPYECELGTPEYYKALKKLRKKYEALGFMCKSRKRATLDYSKGVKKVTVSYQMVRTPSSKK